MPLSRYAARQPFTPLAEFVVARPFDLNGETLTPGVGVQKDGLDERLLRNLYEQRKIEIIDLAAVRAKQAADAAAADAEAARKAAETAAQGEKPATAPATPAKTVGRPRKAAAAPAAEGEKPAAAPATPAKTVGRPRKDAAAPATEGEKPATVPMRYRVKQAGLGGFKVLDEAGVPVGDGWPTHAEAMAEAVRLNDL
jgi:hypothetical protein